MVKKVHEQVVIKITRIGMGAAKSNETTEGIIETAAMVMPEFLASSPVLLLGRGKKRSRVLYTVCACAKITQILGNRHTHTHTHTHTPLLIMITQSLYSYTLCTITLL